MNIILNLKKSYILIIIFLILSFNIYSQNNNVSFIGRWEKGPCYSSAVNDSIAFFGNGGYLEIVDYTNPNNLVEIGKFICPSIIRGITHVDSFLYVANERSGVRIIDITYLTNPAEVGFFDTDGIALDVKVNGDYAYIADLYGLRIINISDPANPFETGFIDTYYAQKVTINDTIAYVADDYEGLKIINISDPYNPTEIGSFNTTGNARGIYYQNNS